MAAGGHSGQAEFMCPRVDHHRVAGRHSLGLCCQLLVRGSRFLAAMIDAETGQRGWFRPTLWNVWYEMEASLA